jgi:hypothetical protein
MAYVRRRPEPNGVYFAGAGGEFVYARRGSAGSTLGHDDVARAPLRDAGAVVVSGITQALSPSCARRPSTRRSVPPAATWSTTRTSARG